MSVVLKEEFATAILRQKNRNPRSAVRRAPPVDKGVGAPYFLLIFILSSASEKYGEYPPNTLI